MRWPIAILLTILALVVIDRASLVVAPCSEYSDARNNHDKADNKECAAREGIVIAGIKWLADIKPEIWTALATVAIAAFTWTLWQSSEKMWRATADGLNLARQEFIASHRPLLKVKLVQVVEGDGERAAINFTVVNVGNSNAYVIGSCAKADFFFPNDWPHPNDYGVNDVIRPRRFVAGATDNYTISTGQLMGLIEVFAEGLQTLRFYGYIVYNDAFKNTRTTFFCREYNRGADCFSPVKRPDYDSTD
jgi:hypothetical protein